METLSRTGLYLLAADGSDDVESVEILRNIVSNLNTKAAIFTQGATLADRPAAGVSGRWFYSDSTPTLLYYDNGTDWVTLGIQTTYTTDGAAGVGCLRTLGVGALQAAAGNHGHGTAGVVGLDAALASLQSQITALGQREVLVRKTLDQTYSESAFGNDTQLVYALQANSKYMIEGSLICDDETWDYYGYWKVAGPSGVTGSLSTPYLWGWYGWGRYYGGHVGVNGSQAYLHAWTYAHIHNMLRGFVVTGGNAGNLQLQFKGLTVKSGSYLSIRQVT